MRIKTMLRVCVFGFGAALYAFPGSAVAQSKVTQEEAEATEGKFDEIVVTAQKREQNANDVGMSISVLSGDALGQLGVNSTADLSRLVPGLTFSDSGFSTPVYTIRGVGFSESSVQATSTVGVYNDQVSVPFPIMSSGLQLDVARVEVLKGPQGTLFGRNSTGGAINYIARRPGNSMEVLMAADYSTFRTFDVTAVVSSPLSDNLGLRVAFRTLQSGEGWQKSVSRNDRLGKQDKIAARVLLDYEPSDTVRVGLAYNFWSDRSDTQAPQFWRADNQRPATTAVVNILDRSIYARVPLYGTDDNQLADWTGGYNRLRRPKADMWNHSLAATVDWDVSDSVEFTSISAYSKFHNDSSYDNGGWGGVPLDYAFNGVTARQTISPLVRPLYANFETLGSVGYTNKASIDAFSQELRVAGKAASINWLVGAYYSYDKVVSDTPQLVEFNTSTNRSPGIPTGLQSTVNPTRQIGKSWSVFTHNELQASDTLKLTAGLRYSEDRKNYRGCTADSGDGDLADFTNFLAGRNIYKPGDCVMTLANVPVTTPYVDQLYERSLSWRLGIDYQLGADTLAYASYSRGFKSGSYPTLTANLVESLFPVVQERVDAFEVGIKASLLDRAVQINLAGYYYDYKDKQLLTKVIVFTGPANSLANIPRSSVHGAEFDVKLFPVKGLYVGFGGSYVKTRVKSFSGYNQVGVEGDFSGAEFPFTPNFQGFGVVNYDFAIASSLRGFVNGDVSYSSSSKSDYDIATVLNNGLNGAGYAALLTRYGATIGKPLPALDVFKLPETLVVGARIGISGENDRWTLSVWGRNLTNEYIVTNSRKSSDAIIAYTGRPRTYGVSLAFKY